MTQQTRRLCLLTVQRCFLRGGGPNLAGRPEAYLPSRLVKKGKVRRAEPNKMYLDPNEICSYPNKT